MSAGQKEPIDSFCAMPFLGMHVSNTGGVSPCCEYDGTLGQASDGALSDIWNSPDWESLRQDFRAGREVKACWKCFDREASEGDSMRHFMNATLAGEIALLTPSPLVAPTQDSPAYLDIRYSNLCNLKCRTCWHGSSSKWYSDAKALDLTAGPKAEIVSFPSPEIAREAVVPLLGAARQIYFAGGEPLVMPEHYRLLGFLIAEGRTHIKLSYNSNMMTTSLGKQSIFDLWEQFPHLSIEASVDAAGSRGALVRSGFDWDVFVANIAELRARCPQVRLTFGITVSALNILALPELLDALGASCQAMPDDLHIHALQSPSFYRTQVLPGKLKKDAGKRIGRFIRTLELRNAPNFAVLQTALEGQLRYMHAENRTVELKTFQKMTARLDRLRGEQSDKVLPELKAALKPSPVRHFAAKARRLLKKSANI